MKQKFSYKIINKKYKKIRLVGHIVNIFFILEQKALKLKFSLTY